MLIIHQKKGEDFFFLQNTKIKEGSHQKGERATIHKKKKVPLLFLWISIQQHFLFGEFFFVSFFLTIIGGPYCFARSTTWKGQESFVLIFLIETKEKFGAQFLKSQGNLSLMFISFSFVYIYISLFFLVFFYKNNGYVIVIET